MKKSVGRYRTRVGLTSGAIGRATVGLVAVAALASCGGTSSTASETTVAASAANTAEQAQVTTPEAPSATAGESSEPAAGAEPTAVPELLQFTAPLVGGGEFNGAGRAGQATAFWFWAPT